MMFAIDTYQPASTFDQHLLRLSQLTIQLSSPWKWSIYILPVINKEFKEIYDLHVDVLEHLRSKDQWLNDLYSVDKIALAQSIDMRKYKELRKLSDHLDRVVAVTNQTKRVVPHIIDSFSTIIDWAIKRAFSFKLLHVSQQTSRLACQQQYMLKKILAKMDQPSFAPIQLFDAIKPDQLWSDRCNAYDYLV
jgi:hypothetical protein